MKFIFCIIIVFFFASGSAFAKCNFQKRYDNFVGMNQVRVEIKRQLEKQNSIALTKLIFNILKNTGSVADYLFTAFIRGSKIMLRSESIDVVGARLEFDIFLKDCFAIPLDQSKLVIVFRENRKF